MFDLLRFGVGFGLTWVVWASGFVRPVLGAFRWL